MTATGALLCLRCRAPTKQGVAAEAALVHRACAGLNAGDVRQADGVVRTYGRVQRWYKVVAARAHQRRQQ